MLQSVSRRHWSWGSLTAASIHATFRPQTSAPFANQASSPALGFTWWLADGRCGPAEVDLLCEVAAQERYIGEVGLDFSARFAGSEPLQIQAFDRLCDTLVQHPLTGRVISIHAVRSAGAVLGVLESHGLLIPNPDSPLSSSTGLAALRTNSSARVMRAVIFPSTNACSRLNEDANTHDRFHSIVYCSRPMHQRRQTQK